MREKRSPKIALRRRRLLALADFLEKQVKPSLNGAKFNMFKWGDMELKWEDIEGVSRQALKERMETRSLSEAAHCGFEGCAIGWAFYHPALIKAGIREFIKVYVKSAYHHGFAMLDVRDVGLGAFFGVTQYEFTRLFVPGGGEGTYGSSGIKAVCKRLREVAAKTLPEEELFEIREAIIDREHAR